MEIDVSILSRMKHTRFIVDIPYVVPHCLIFLLDVALLIPDSSARCPCHLCFFQSPLHSFSLAFLEDALLFPQQVLCRPCIRISFPPLFS
jgi:hypothetical protein